MTIGKDLDGPKAQKHMAAYFNQLTKYSRDKNYISRIRFMCQDLTELRENDWVPRTKKQEAKTLAEIQKDHQKEQAAKSSSSGRESTPVRDPRGPLPSRPTPTYTPRVTTPSGSTASIGSQDARRINLATPPPRKPQQDRYSLEKPSPSQDKDVPSPLPQRELTPTTMRRIRTPSQELPTPNSKDRSASRESYESRESANNRKLDWIKTDKNRRGSGSNALLSSKSGYDSVEGGNWEIVSRKKADSRLELPKSKSIDSYEMQGITSTPKISHSMDDIMDDEPEKSNDGKENEKMKKKIKALIEEYMTALDLKEATLCIEELKNPTQHYEVVIEAFMFGVETSKDYRTQTINLLTKLYENKTLTPEDFSKGLHYTLKDLDDVIVDMPHATKFIAQMAATFVTNGVLEIEALDGLKSIVENGEAAQFCVHFLKQLEAEKGTEGAAKLWHDSGLEISELVKPNENLNKFLDDHKIRQLVGL